MPQSRLPLLLLTVAFAAACADDDPSCPDGATSRDGRCITADASSDAAAADASSDAAAADASPCGTCPDGSFCDPASLDCVQCIDDSHCPADKPFCSSEGTCVQCTQHDHCSDTNNAQCDPDSHACVPCDDDSHCEHLDLNVCSSGTCLQCDASNEASACPSGVCDILSGSCSSETPGSADPCQPCVSDAQCGRNAKCVPMDFQGNPFGNFCLHVLPDGGVCSEPFTSLITGRSSLNGETGLTFCGINEARTTCSAVRALLDNTPCSTDGADPCPTGGFCRDFGAAGGNRCTYPCGGNAECPDVASFGTCSGGSGSDADPNFCGG